MVRRDDLVVDHGEVALGELVDVALGRRGVVLSEDAEWRSRIERSRRFLEEAISAGRSVYGVTTGVGYSSSRKIAEDAMEEFADIIVSQHGCGVGVPLSVVESRAVVFARLVSLAKGYSAVRSELLQALCDLLNRGVTPLIPRYGSVGASGDLTPLSYVVAVLRGEREAIFNGEVMDAVDALREAGLKPLQMVPKEQLAVMNGTSVMTAVGSLCAARLTRVLELGERTSAVTAELLFGRSDAYHPTAHRVKPHPGQLASAAAIRDAIAGGSTMDQLKEGRIIQDPYSIRCAPQVFGAARDALSWVGEVLQRELNSVNDNPIVDPDTGDILFAGNFYGGHVALAMDLVKVAAASVADLHDRQFALLVDTRFNLGLPETLVDYGGNGTKALQITASALTALAVQRTASDTVLSRPTEVNNQDKVSMGLNAAMNATDVTTILEQVLATEMIALSNAAALRDEALLSPAARRFLAVIRELSPVLEHDRRLDLEMEELVTRIDDLGAEF